MRRSGMAAGLSRTLRPVLRRLVAQAGRGVGPPAATSRAPSTFLSDDANR